MKRTTIYFDPELEVLLKLEMLRQRRPMADIVRQAVHAYVTSEPRQAPPGAGAFTSGQTDIAGRVDEVLRETGFGAEAGMVAPARKAAPGKSKKKR
jgi:hypothetical protein